MPLTEQQRTVLADKALSILAREGIATMSDEERVSLLTSMFVTSCLLLRDVADDAYVVDLLQGACDELKSAPVLHFVKPN